MEGRIRPKLTQALATVLMIAAAIFVPLSGNIVHSHAAPASSQASWNIVPSPNPVTGNNLLDSVATISSNDVWAVGNSQVSANGNAYQALIEHWNGTSWSAASSPSTAGRLNGVAAVSSNDVWAVGTNDSTNNSPTAQTLIMHWEYDTASSQYMWKTYTSPNPGTGNVLNAVTAITSDNVWAVGQKWDTSANASQPLIVHWDGSNWTEDTNLEAVGYNSYLTAITAVSATDIWAVGGYQCGSYYTLAMHYEYDTSSQTYKWKIKDSPNANSINCYNGLDTDLTGVTAIASNDIWATGFAQVDGSGYDSSPSYTFTMHWDGSSWTQIDSPNPSNAHPYLYGVAKVSASDVWAVGYSYDGTTNQALTMHYDGTSWTIVSSPPVASSVLSGVAAVSSDDVWAVGNSSSGTLTEHYYVVSPTPSPSPSPSPTETQTVTPTPSPTPHRQLVIFLQGITTSLDANQANKGEIAGMRTVPSTVKKVFPGASINPNASTRFLEYSYFASRTDNGLPAAYNCVDTITNSLLLDIFLLDKQIKNAFKVEPAGAEVDIYLIGHSLGGAVALTYLDFLEQGLLVSLPSHAHLKAVITLDSPIGGVAEGFLTDFSLFGRKILEANCPAVKGQPFTAPKDLETVFNSASKTTPPEPDDSSSNPKGAQASLLVADFLGTLPAPIPSNEDLAERAQTDLGTSFLSIGNLNDFLWDPHACAGSLPSFLDTQFLEDEGDGSGLYGRDFVSGQGTCPGIYHPNQTKQIVNNNHGAVLSDGNVQLGIKKFLTPLVSGNIGGTPGALVINPFQSTEP